MRVGEGAASDAGKVNHPGGCESRGRVARQMDRGHS